MAKFSPSEPPSKCRDLPVCPLCQALVSTPHLDAISTSTYQYVYFSQIFKTLLFLSVYLCVSVCERNSVCECLCVSVCRCVHMFFFLYECACLCVRETEC